MSVSVVPFALQMPPESFLLEILNHPVERELGSECDEEICILLCIQMVVGLNAVHAYVGHAEELVQVFVNLIFLYKWRKSLEDQLSLASLYLE